MSLVAKGLAFALQLAIVYHFGARGPTDLYFWCVNFLVGLSGLLCCLDSTIVIPNAVHFRNAEGAAAMNGFLRSVIRWYVVVTLAVTALLASFPVEIVTHFSKLNPAEVAGNAAFIRMIFLSLPSMVMAFLMADILAIDKIFSLSVAAEVGRGLVTLGIFLAFRRWLASEAIAIGFLAGSLVQFGILAAVLSGRQTGNAESRRRSGAMTMDVLVALAGQTSFFAYTMIVAYLISGFPEGVYSAMNCAQSLTVPIQMIFLTKLSYVIGMYFIEHYSRGRYSELNTLFLEYLKPVLLGLLALIPFLAFFSGPLVNLVFLRGGFHRADAETTGVFLALFSLSLPFLFVDSYVTQLILGAKKVRSGVILQVASSIANILCIWFLTRRYGYIGYPIGLLAVRSVYLLVLWAYLRRVFPFLDFGAALIYLARNILSIGAATGAVLSLQSHPVLMNLLFPVAVSGGIWLWPENRRLIMRIGGYARGKLTSAF